MRRKKQKENSSDGLDGTSLRTRWTRLRSVGELAHGNLLVRGEVKRIVGERTREEANAHRSTSGAAGQRTFDPSEIRKRWEGRFTSVGKVHLVGSERGGLQDGFLKQMKGRGVGKRPKEGGRRRSLTASKRRMKESCGGKGQSIPFDGPNPISNLKAKELDILRTRPNCRGERQKETWRRGEHISAHRGQFAHGTSNTDLGRVLVS